MKDYNQKINHCHYNQKINWWKIIIKTIIESAMMHKKTRKNVAFCPHLVWLHGLKYISRKGVAFMTHVDRSRETLGNHILWQLKFLRRMNLQLLNFSAFKPQRANIAFKLTKPTRTRALGSIHMSPTLYALGLKSFFEILVFSPYCRFW